MTRLAVAACAVVLTACGSVHPVGSASARPTDSVTTTDEPSRAVWVARTGSVPWVPLPAAHQTVEAPPALPVPPIPIPAGTPACRADQMEGVGLAAGVAAGNVDMPLLLRNRGNIDCKVEGFADVTVLDRLGHVLASAAGSAGRGTFFNDGPLVPLLMPAHTAPLPASFATREGSSGQVFMNFSWYDCQRPLASRIAIGLPSAGGTFFVPYATAASVNPRCQSSSDVYHAISRGPLSPAAVQWPPPLDLIGVRVEVNAPSSARRGMKIDYQVTITNISTRDYDMLPCADYFDALEVKRLLATHQLNCAPVGHLAPGASATFDMQADVPMSIAPGSNRLSWFLADDRVDYAGSSAPIEIT